MMCAQKKNAEKAYKKERQVISKAPPRHPKGAERPPKRHPMHPGSAPCDTMRRPSGSPWTPSFVHKHGIVFMC